MKVLLLVLSVALIACGGIKPPVGDPVPRATPIPFATPTPVPTPITADQVFSNIAETWELQDGFGCLLFVDVMPVDATHTIWHYHKNCTGAYWAPGVAAAELYFFLDKDPTNGNAWYSSGGRILMPQGCGWCTPTPTSPVDFTYGVFSVVGHPRPYLILGNSGTGVDTFYANSPTNTRWITKMYVQDGFLISEQWEANSVHPDGSPCGHEKWWFKPGSGLWKIEPLDQGGCVDVDPRLNMERIN